MRIVLADQDEVIKDLSFDEGPITIGSNASCHVHLPDLGLALEHARLVMQPGGQWLFENVHPQAASAVNDRPVDKRVPIYSGDRISIGRFTVTFLIEGQTDFGPTGKTSLDELAKIKEFPLPRHSEVKQPDEPIQLDSTRQQWLARFSAEVNTWPDLKVLLDRTLTHLIETFDAGKAWLGLRPQPMGPLELMAGRTREGEHLAEPPLRETFEYRCLDRGQQVRLRKTQDGNSAIVVPLEAQRGRFGVIYVESKPSRNRFRAPDLDWLAAQAAYLAHRVEQLFLATGGHADLPLMAAETGGDDTQLISTAQAQLQPPKVPSWSGCRVLVYRQAGFVRVGNLCDFVTLPNGLGAVLLVDVQGEPTRAALAMAELRAAAWVACVHNDPPKAVLRVLNWLLANGRDRCTAHAAMVAFNPQNGALEVATAGEMGALIVDAQGTPRKLTEGVTPALGLHKSLDFARHSDRLDNGGLLALFTAGVRAVEDRPDRPLDQGRVVELLGNAAGLDADQAIDEIEGDLAALFRNQELPDDITIIVLVRR